MSEEFETMGTELPEKETAAEETKAEEQEVKEPEVIESMDDFTEEIEASLQKIYPGDVMECTVAAVDETAVSVDLDYYAPGKIPPEEMSADPLFSVFTDVQIGDQFKAVVQQADDGAGNIKRKWLGHVEIIRINHYYRGSFFHLLDEKNDGISRGVFW